MNIWICVECDDRRTVNERPARGMCYMSEDGEGPHAWARFEETLAGAAANMTSEERREITVILEHLEQGAAEW